MVKTRLILLSAILLATASTVSCTSEDGDDNSSSSSGGSSSGSKGNNIDNYETITIGEQIWMAENLDYEVEGSRCYKDEPENCFKYGRLYNWDAAKTACPAGWHLPTDDEWGQLVSYVENNKECSDCAGRYLKAASGWGDNFGFEALPGGMGTSGGSSGDSDAGSFGYWWTATAVYEKAYYRWIFYKTDGVSRNEEEQSNMYSVRCVLGSK